MPSSQEGEGFKTQMEKLINALDALRSQFADAMQRNGGYSNDPYLGSAERAPVEALQRDHSIRKATATPATNFLPTEFPAINHSTMDIPLPDGMKRVALLSEDETEKSERIPILGIEDSVREPVPLQKKVSISEHVSTHNPTALEEEENDVPHSVHGACPEDISDAEYEIVSREEEKGETAAEGSYSDLYEEEFEDDFEDEPCSDIEDEPEASNPQEPNANDSPEDNPIEDVIGDDPIGNRVSSEMSGAADKSSILDEDYSMSYGDDLGSADRSAEEEDYADEAFSTEEGPEDHTEIPQIEEQGRDQIEEPVNPTQKSESSCSPEINDTSAEQCELQSGPGSSAGAIDSPVQSSVSISSSQVVDDIVDKLTRELSFESNADDVI